MHCICVLTATYNITTYDGRLGLPINKNKCNQDIIDTYNSIDSFSNATASVNKIWCDDVRRKYRIEVNKSWGKMLFIY